MLSSVILFTLVGSLHGSPQQSNYNLRIHNGHKTNLPFVLQLVDKKNRTYIHVCTASLIKSQYVITAAHCLIPNSIGRTITYGCSNLNSPSCRKVQVNKVSIHPDYQPTSGLRRPSYDIAVLKLAFPLKNIATIRLPNENESIPTKYATVVGYGVNERNITDNFQKSVRLLIASNAYYGAPSENILVLHTTGAIDRGDSGGPLIFNNALYGVASFTSVFQGQVKQRLGVYTSVKSCMEFIQTSIRYLEKQQ